MTRTLIKITILLASTLTVMAGATIAPSLPAMQDHFYLKNLIGANAAQSGLAIAFMTLFFLDLVIYLTAP
jgi:hypothetical protein